ncbi:myosin-11-like, partial [Diaphorina citri]|uniref:Myosin-11-like n=1 Tax=Diaphorina citri TaxID=121845 RepID=A0A3Q0IX30_DIACI
MLEKKLTVQPSRRDQGTCVEDKHPTEGKQETTKLIEEFKDQKENNKMILNKLEHLESLYTLITNKDDLVKELELYNQAKSKVTNLESEIMMFKCKNTEMKEKLNQMKAEIKQYEKLTSELKQNLKEEKNKNEECCKKYEELKDENDNLQSQVCNLSADLENIKKDDDMRNKYEHTKSLLELTNEKLENLKMDYETVKKELSDRNEKYICDHRMLKQELELAEKSKQEISAQYEITKLELKSSNDYVTELKSHYEILLTQPSREPCKLLSSLSSTKYLSLGRDIPSPDLGIDSDHGRVSNSETSDNPVDFQARERELRLKYSRRETELKRQLETLTLNNSEIILERARLANEKLRLQQEMRDKSGAVPLNVYTLLDDPRTTTFPHASMSLAKGFANPKYSHGPVSLPLGFNSPSLLHDLTLFRPTNSTHKRQSNLKIMDKHPTEGKQETTKLIEEFKDQKENNKMILNKLEHLESLYTLITNKDDLVKELELYNQAKSKVTNLESEIMMFKCKNTEMKEKLNQMKAEIKQYEKLTSELKQNLKEEKNKNEECCKKYEELKDENDNLQSQVCNLSADLENIKKDDDMRNKYEHTKSLLELTNEKLENLKMDYETVKKELSDRNEKYICDHRMLKQELELAEKSKQEISAQYEITKLELKSSNDYVTELKSHYEILLTQLSKSNETIDDLNSKLNQAKVDLEHSSNKLDLMNSNLSETQETLTQLKLNLNDEIHNSKLYKDENERLMNKISVMENNKRTWEKEINALRLTLKKYRENEEKEMSKHTELVCEMTRKIEEFKHERIQLNYDIRELKRKIEELTKEKEEMSRKFEETQEKVLKQNDRALQEIQNEMKVKLESANEKIVQKDDKLEQIEDLYKVQILEQLKVQLEKRVDELEVSNMELEAKLASYGSGGKFSDHELTSGGEEGYPGSPRRSLCTPPPSPNRRGSSGSSPASPAQVSSLSFFLFFSYLSFYFKQKERGA